MRASQAGDDISQSQNANSTRWANPLRESEVTTFIQTYMPWVSLQRKRSSQQAEKDECQNLLNPTEPLPEAQGEGVEASAEFK